MVKKTYISPEMLTVQLSATTHLMQQSIEIKRGSGVSISSSSDILVKETNPSDVNLWDNEW